MELDIKNGLFWILEDKSDEKNIQRYAYVDEKSAIDRIRQLLKSVDVQNLLLATVDVSSKEWKIASVPWATIAMGLVRGEIVQEPEK